MKSYYLTLIIAIIGLFFFDEYIFTLALIFLSVFLFSNEKLKDSSRDDRANIRKKYK
jgi:hypothetical protein